MIHLGDSYGHIIINLISLIADDSVEQTIGNSLWLFRSNLLNETLDPQLLVHCITRGVINAVGHHNQDIPG
ncbi:hypothetical protein D3C86_2026320 [compost metagenome]